MVVNAEVVCSVVWGVYHARRALHAFPRRGTPVQYTLVYLALKRRRREIIFSECMCPRSRLYPLATSTEFSVSNYTTGVYSGGSNTHADGTSTPMAYYRKSLVQWLNPGFSPLNNGTAVFVKIICIDRVGSEAPPNSSPGYGLDSAAPPGWSG